MIARRLLLGGGLAGAVAWPADAQTQLTRDAQAALKVVGSSGTAASITLGRAVATLVFPRIGADAHLMGGSGGDGVVRRAGRMQGLYHINTGNPSTFTPVPGRPLPPVVWGCALAFMTEAAWVALTRTNPFIVGQGPQLAVLTAQDARGQVPLAPICGFVFDRGGLIEGPVLPGSRITALAGTQGGG